MRAVAGPRAPDRAQATRAALLDAARAVFVAEGFGGANITEVVRRAEASVGSLYHHFDGKADLFLTLYEDYHARQEQRVSAAVRAAREDGERGPGALFLTGARRFLEGCWDERKVAMLFLSGDGPPGFEVVRRRRYLTWVQMNAKLLRAGEDPRGTALTHVLTSVTSEAGREVAGQPTRRKALRFADEVIVLMERIVTG